MEKVVGNGAFGIVWRAREEGGNGSAVAIKKVILDRRYHNRELEMMKGMDHECVIRLLNHFEKPGRKKDETYLHLVMEYCPETIRSVALQYHKQRTRFPIDHIRVYLFQARRAPSFAMPLTRREQDHRPHTRLAPCPPLLRSASRPWSTYTRSGSVTPWVGKDPERPGPGCGRAVPSAPAPHTLAAPAALRVPSHPFCAELAGASAAHADSQDASGRASRSPPATPPPPRPRPPALGQAIGT